MSRTAQQTLSYGTISWGCPGVLEALAHVNNPRRSLRAPVTAPLLRCGLPHTLPAAPCSLLGRGAETRDAASSLPAWPWDAASSATRTVRGKQGKAGACRTGEWEGRAAGRPQPGEERLPAGSASSLLVTAPGGSHTHGLARLQMCASHRLTYPTDRTSHSIPQIAQIRTPAGSYALLTPAGSHAPHWQHPAPQHPFWGRC